MSQKVHAADNVENNTFVNDSVYYQDGVYYQLIPDKDGVKDNALAVVDWDEDMVELNVPEGVYIDMPADSISMSRTRKYKFIIWFKPKPKLLIMNQKQYKVSRILFSADIEFSPDVDFSVYEFLASLDLPLNMKEIRPRCFKNCKALTSFTVKKNIERIGEEAFQGCTALREVNLTNSKVSVIHDRAFADCVSLRHVSLDGDYNLDYIYSKAFENCISLTEVRLPACLDYISRDSFEGCVNISSYDISGNYDYASYYSYDGCIYNKGYNNEKSLYMVPPAKKTIVIDSEATEIGNKTFYGNNNISTIYIPDNIAKIGEAAFTNCKLLKKIRLSERLKTIPDSCFYGCEMLEQIKIPESVEKIGAWAFSKCNLITSIEIHSHVKFIGDGAFADCASMQNFAVNEWNTDYVAHNGLLYHCGYKSGYVYSPYDLHLISCPAGKDKVVLDEETVRIREFSFYGCRKFSTLHIPSKVYYVEPKAFYSCDSFEKFSVSNENERYECRDGILIESGYSFVSVPGGIEEVVINHEESNLTEILTNAFYGSSKLRKVTFMKYQNIYAPNFIACDSISEINLYDWIEFSVYYNESECFSPHVYETAQLNVYYDIPELKSLIEESPYWSKFKNINYIEIGGVEDIPSEENGEEAMPVTVYSINGMKVGNNTDDLTPGVYIIRQGAKTKKIIKTNH